MTNPYNSSEYKKNRKIVLEANNYICAYCGDHANTVDHILAIAKGGSHNIDNLVSCCNKCNSIKQDRTRVRLPYINPRYRSNI